MHCLPCTGSYCYYLLLLFGWILSFFSAFECDLCNVPSTARRIFPGGLGQKKQQNLPKFYLQITLSPDPRRALRPVSDSPFLSTEDTGDAPLSTRARREGLQRTQKAEHPQQTWAMTALNNDPRKNHQLHSVRDMLKNNHICSSLSSLLPPKKLQNCESRSFQVLHISCKNLQTFAHAVPSLTMLFLRFLAGIRPSPM